MISKTEVNQIIFVKMRINKNLKIILIFINNYLYNKKYIFIYIYVYYI